MNILLLNPNYIKRPNWGHQLFKNEFGRQHNVTYFGSGYPGFKATLTVPQILKRLKKKFDLILTYESKYSRNFQGLGEIKDIPKALIQIDYAIGIPNYKGFAKIANINKLININKPDLIFATSMSNVDAMKATFNTDKIFFLPFSVDLNTYKNMNLKRTIDAMAVFTTKNDVYPERRKVQTILKKMNIAHFTNRIIHTGYVRKLNQSKIFVISNNINKRLSMKYTEAMACGALVLADEPEDLETQGFKRGDHLVIYDGLEDLKTKIKYYLKNDMEREMIAKDGMNFVRNRHSCEMRVKQFTKIVKREFGI
ncbi:MAG TPA: glycosyltransferase [Candidatus Glassbacteria bacterium]|nr:glycosyltransferase [Candidatus Glassbacteria bacterium]